MSDEIESSITVARMKKRHSAHREEYAGNSDAHHEEQDARSYEERSGNGHYQANGAHRPHGKNGDTKFAWGEPNGAKNDPDRALPFSEPEAAGPGFSIPFDPWRLLAALGKRWVWLVTGTAALAALAFITGVCTIKYKVSVNLIRRSIDNPFGASTQDPLRPRDLSDQTLFAFMKSGEVLKRVAEKAQPPISPEALAGAIAVVPSQNPDILGLSVSGRSYSQSLVDLANLYAEQVVKFTQEMQATESGDINKYLKEKLTIADNELQKANRELAEFAKGVGITDWQKDTDAYLVQAANADSKYESTRIELATIDLKIGALTNALSKQTPSNDKLQAAKDELSVLLLKYKEAHPIIQAQRKKIEMIEKQPAEPFSGNPIVDLRAPGTLGNSMQAQLVELQGLKASLQKQLSEYGDLKNKVKDRLSGMSEDGVRYAMLRQRINSLTITRELLEKRQRDTQLFVENALGYYRVFAPATLRDVNLNARWMKITLLSIIGGMMGLFFAASLVMITEAFDTRLKTAADVQRVTDLPVLATLGDLAKMSPTEQVNWAFRTLTILKGKLSMSSNQGLVCGIISSGHGEGRSTWVNLLVSAASQRGLKVLTVDTRPTAAGPAAHCPNPDESISKALSTNVLASPMQVTQQLTQQMADPNTQPVVHIPLPGWVWNLERRQQWQSALAQWKKIDNLVLLVELPPASQPEAILLAENLPQLIWLTGSGMAKASETVTQLETLRHAHCNLVGAVLNQEPPPPLFNRLARRFAKAACFLGLLGGLEFVQPELSAATPVEAQTNLTLSVSTPRKRAAWQEKLTLGPGDALDFTLFGQPELTRTNLFVGPDGRISYLQAQDIPATGLTIEELRAKFDQELSQYYTSVRTIITPVAFHSKKYFVLGKVAGKGAYVLDRPMTIVEAVARAKGLETGLFERNTVELADLSRSFLVRNGQRLEVNFQKLFLEGDLSQNIPIEPNDYLYFAGTAVNEIYVLGEVMNPGPLGFVPDASLITALTDRGGFTPKAYKKKILVIRGSLNEPETFVVDAASILGARSTDFKLQARDIVYVSARPWIKVEELLDDATQSFIQGAVTAWTGANIGPIIKKPILPDI